ncbi:unnamed protein product [Protopolystoma xenopodis]|uniref:Uncharacterized protein n=1 Tax=Protopolystoma xenopodis TaxID=117903 RepID=A0A3S4ZTL5_9PLAT|nr:unnamed protein product [Protopolystoma xenopodis]
MSSESLVQVRLKKICLLETEVDGLSSAVGWLCLFKMATFIEDCFEKAGLLCGRVLGWADIIYLQSVTDSPPIPTGQPADLLTPRATLSLRRAIGLLRVSKTSGQPPRESPPPAENGASGSVDWRKFDSFLGSAAETRPSVLEPPTSAPVSPGDSMQLWCVHCPLIWADFVTRIFTVQHADSSSHQPSSLHQPQVDTGLGRLDSFSDDPASTARSRSHLVDESKTIWKTRTVRQPFCDPLPLTLWLLRPLFEAAKAFTDDRPELSKSNSHSHLEPASAVLSNSTKVESLSTGGMLLLVDLEALSNPLDIRALGTLNACLKYASRQKTFRFYLGAEPHSQHLRTSTVSSSLSHPQISTNQCKSCAPTLNSNMSTAASTQSVFSSSTCPSVTKPLPDALDHLIFLIGLADRVARIQACLGLDSRHFTLNSSSNLSESHLVMPSSKDSLLESCITDDANKSMPIMSIFCCLCRPLELQITLPDPATESSRLRAAETDEENEEIKSQSQIELSTFPKNQSYLSSTKHPFKHSSSLALHNISESLSQQKQEQLALAINSVCSEETADSVEPGCSTPVDVQSSHSQNSHSLFADPTTHLPANGCLEGDAASMFFGVHASVPASAAASCSPSSSILSVSSVSSNLSYGLHSRSQLQTSKSSNSTAAHRHDAGSINDLKVSSASRKLDSPEGIWRNDLAEHKRKAMPCSRSLVSLYLYALYHFHYRRT